MGPLEALYVERLTVALLHDAALDMIEGAPSLRREAWGIMRPNLDPDAPPTSRDGRRIRFAHYRPPRGVYLEARLTVASELRGYPRPFPQPMIDEGLAQLDAWLRARGKRLPIIGYQQTP